MLFKIGKFVRRYNLPKQRFSFQDKILSQGISSTKSKPIKRFTVSAYNFGPLKADGFTLRIFPCRNWLMKVKNELKGYYESGIELQYLFYKYCFKIYS